MLAKKAFSNLSNDYEITMDGKTEVTEVCSSNATCGLIINNLFSVKTQGVSHRFPTTLSLSINLMTWRKMPLSVGSKESCVPVVILMLH